MLLLRKIVSLIIVVLLLLIPVALGRGKITLPCVMGDLVEEEGYAYFWKKFMYHGTGNVIFFDGDKMWFIRDGKRCKF